jgi:hypothetical protein
MRRTRAHKGRYEKCPKKRRWHGLIWAHAPPLGSVTKQRHHHRHTHRSIRFPPFVVDVRATPQEGKGFASHSATSTNSFTHGFGGPCIIYAQFRVARLDFCLVERRGTGDCAPKWGRCGMSVDHWLKSGSANAPDCRCGKRMTAFNTVPVPEPTDAQILVYRCASCQHEMRLTVWSADALN